MTKSALPMKPAKKTRSKAFAERVPEETHQKIKECKEQGVDVKALLIQTIDYAHEIIKKKHPHR